MNTRIATATLLALAILAAAIVAARLSEPSVVAESHTDSVVQVGVSPEQHANDASAIPAVGGTTVAAATATAGLEIATQEVLYSVGPVHLHGYLAYPVGVGKRPGVIVVHEWWGHNAYVRQRAEMLARLGYTAFALDMYGDGKLAEHPKDANTFMMEVVNDAPTAVARFRQAVRMLRNHPATDPEKIASIGYCFGGSVSLSMARMGEDLKGAVSFHGGLQGLAPIADKEIRTPMLILNGADDPFVSAEQKQAFRAEMDAAGLSYELIDYPGVLHSFTDPGADAKGAAFGLPLQYDAVADGDSWQRMQVFLQSIFE